jgi:hypothetical protein
MNIWTVASACVTQRAQLSALQLLASIKEVVVFWSLMKTWVQITLLTNQRGLLDYLCICILTVLKIFKYRRIPQLNKAMF